MKMHPQWRKWKKHQQGLAAVPEVLCVTSPQLEDIPSCELKMLSENLKTKGPSSVLVELASQNLGWLCSAIGRQFRQGTFSSGYVISREKRRKVDTASEGGVDEGSDDNDGGRGSDDSSTDASKSSDRDEFPQEQADEAQHEQPEYIAQETDEVPEAASSVLVIAEDDMAEDNNSYAKAGVVGASSRWEGESTRKGHEAIDAQRHVPKAIEVRGERRQSMCPIRWEPTADSVRLLA